jgi:hypothetical protein
MVAKDTLDLSAKGGYISDITLILARKVKEDFITGRIISKRSLYYYVYTEGLLFPLRVP